MESATQLRERGYVVVRGLLDPDEVRHYRELLAARSGIVGSQGLARGRGKGGWNHTDGVSQDPDFWDLIFHPRLHEKVGEVIGSGFKYLQHSDLQVGFSAIAWHRDNVNRTYGLGPDWDEGDGLYGLVRVGIYLHDFEEVGFRLGFIPGSHRVQAGMAGWRRSLRERFFQVQGILAYLGPRLQQATRAAEWIETGAGDAIIFDPRILHSGSFIRGLKMSMFLGFGQEGRHFSDLHNYYLHVRKELGYHPLDEALVRALEEAGLHAEPKPGSPSEDAYIPIAPIRRLVAGRTAQSARR